MRNLRIWTQNSRTWTLHLGGEVCDYKPAGNDMIGQRGIMRVRVILDPTYKIVSLTSAVNWMKQNIPFG